MKKVLVLYSGETPIGTGNDVELSKMIGVTRQHIQKMSTPKFIKKYEDKYKLNPNTKMMYVVKVNI